ncbi:hypothetical protein QZH41_015565 [Actinostola sp. cb2023]|nr:hypothetical protein QZH41_015565 [Actinostola sp. cb2023]
MEEEAKKDKISPFGRHGAIVFDEMSIQADVQMKQRNGQWEIIGVTGMKEIESMTKSEKGVQLATHILQFLFLGNTGFRFPVCHFATTEASSINLFESFWECVDTLDMYGFTVRLCICDGAGVNRKFVSMHFDDNNKAEEALFTTISPCSGKSLTFVMDPSHNFKKIRNAVEKSKTNGVKQLAFDEEEILWAHLRKAYEYDITHNSLQTHRHLTEDHFHLTSTSKMRNYLADDVLGEDMLNLVKVYQRHLRSKGGKAEELNLTILFLEKTSKLLKNFKHRSPYCSLEDTRFAENRECLNWLKSWESNATSQSGLSKKDKHRRFLPDQSKFDVFSMILGFESFCQNMFDEFPGSGILTCRTNQDTLENFFCGARSINGQNNNPTAAQYESGVNALTQMNYSGGNKSNCAVPLRYYKEGPLTKRAVDISELYL